MPNIGPLELIIVLAVLLVIFGPKRLPGLGRQLGTGLREFKDSITSKSDRDDDDEDEDRDRQRAELGSAPAEQPAPPASAAGDPEVVAGEVRPQDQHAPRAD